ncbi:MAG: alpha-L-rhamnosidase [Kiritimatiellae bacterium]|nr:alpha-L-rhamnosidase [Kiritimatiellia bacterium]
MGLAVAAAALMGAGDPYDYKELVAREVRPAKVARNADGRLVADFGRDAVGWLELAGDASGPYEIVLGELLGGRGEVTNAYPRSTIRCLRVKGVKPAGRHRVPMPPDGVNLRGYDPKAPAIRLPERFGVVMPFRYAEVVSGPAAELRQFAVNYPIDMGKSAFECDSPDLVRVYDFCKYSILATSFCGVYVDGDRERTPYEADAYINQLGHYAIDDDCSLARKSHEWLMDHPTWPTEWKQHSIKMAWADWMWTGDTRSLAKFYDRLRDEKLMAGYARASDGLLETGGERLKGAKPGAADIVDWPEAERDGFAFRPVNAVVNAFYYRNLLEMADIARALGKAEDARSFASRAAGVGAAFQRAFLDRSTGLYVDGEGASHSSLHANAAALAFGLVPPERTAGVVAFLERKGMACSVYFAQYLLEALCEAGRADAAVRLMSAKGDRSWVGMMDFGSTVSMEAWSIAAKPNLDLNHAWGAAPLNVIARYIVGVTPLEAGFRTAAIRPQLGGLGRVKAVVPTVAGPIRVEATPERLVFDSPVRSEVAFAGRRLSFPAGRHEVSAR